MKKFLFGLSAAALAFIVGCASEPAVKQTDTGNAAAAVAAVDGNLAKLRSLSVFEVGALVVQAPANSPNCYGQPPECGEQVDAEMAQARATQAVRLAALTEAASAAMGAAQQPAACEQPAIDANLAKLRALQIVAVGALVVDKPAANGYCYGQPCPAEREAARKVTCERAADLAGIAAATQGM